MNVTLFNVPGCKEKQDNQPPVNNNIEAELDISFNRYESSDTWEKNKELWFSWIDESFWLPLYNQNYFVISGASQGSKIFAAIGLERLQRRPGVNYATTEPSLIILALYSNIISVNSAGDDVTVLLEPKQAGYDAAELTRSPLSNLPYKRDNEGFIEYNFVFKDRAGVVLHQEKVVLSELNESKAQ